MDLNNFNYIRTLSTNPTEKKAVLLGKIQDKPGQAIIIITTKTPQLHAPNFKKITQIFQNDIYWKYEVELDAEYSIQAIYPVTEKHIDKYTERQTVLFEETPEVYQTHSATLLEKELKHIQWVKNIVEGKAQVERVLFKNENFVILPDFKFSNLKQIENLHLLTIFTNEKLYSLRDLTGDHVQMLQQAKKEITKVMKDIFNIDEGLFRMYFHYPPTFYRLHIHVASINNNSYTALSDRSHNLTTVICNLQICSNYYRKITFVKTITKS